MEMNEAVLEFIEIKKLREHPRNPRIITREDVINAIVNDLVKRGKFNQEYALRVGHNL